MAQKKTPVAKKKASVKTKPSAKKKSPAKKAPAAKNKAPAGKASPRRNISKKKLPLTPENRKKLRQKNLKAFEKYQPEIHKQLVNYTAISELVIGEDGEPDTVFNDQYFYNHKHKQYCDDQLKGFWRQPSRFSLSALSPHQFDKYAGEYLHNLLLRNTKEGMEFSPNPVTDEAYFFLSFGIGLGGVIDRLVEHSNCHALILVEPNFEFLFHSLEVYDWADLFKWFDNRDGKVMIYAGNQPEILAQKIRMAIRATNPGSLDGMYIFSHYNNAIFARTSAIVSEDRDLIVAGLGFLDDEMKMMRNAHYNLYPGTSKLYLRPTDKPLSLPSFVIGCGPSLDRDIPFIKENANKAIILACGSAVRPLLVNGIIPDFQIEVENDDIFPLVQQVAKDFDLSPIRLLTSVTGERQVLDYFEEIIFYLRGSLSPYPVFHQTEEQTLRYCNPTVSNAGLSFAQEVGSREIYLFGTDMGSMDPDIHHSKDAYHYTTGAEFADQIYNIPIPGNFGGTCHTSNGLYWARDAISHAIKQISQGRIYYNCSNGGLIEGAVTTSSRSIKLPEPERDKKALIDEMVKGFTVYSAELFDTHWQDETIVESMTGYIESIRDILKAQNDFSDKRYLTDMLKILEGVFGRLPAMNALIFRGSIFMSVMSFEFYRERLINRDQIRAFEEIGREEFYNLLDTLLEVAVNQIGSLTEKAGPRKATEEGA